MKHKRWSLNIQLIDSSKLSPGNFEIADKDYKGWEQLSAIYTVYRFADLLADFNGIDNTNVRQFSKAPQFVDNTSDLPVSILLAIIQCAPVKRF
jgi:hypothetical protein